MEVHWWRGTNFSPKRELLCRSRAVGKKGFSLKGNMFPFGKSRKAKLGGSLEVYEMWLASEAGRRFRRLGRKRPNLI